MDFKTFDIETVAKQIHENSKDKGFWKASSNMNVKRALIITELAEAIEAHRLDKRADVDTLMNEYIEGSSSQSADHFQEFKQLKFFKNEDQILFVDLFQRHVKDTVEDELADTYIRCLDLLIKEYDIWSVKLNALRFNVSNALERVVFTDKFAENIYLLFRGAFIDRAGVDWTESICWGVDKIAEIESIDLQTHIELKMTYNRTRDNLHGKEY